MSRPTLPNGLDLQAALKGASKKDVELYLRMANVAINFKEFVRYAWYIIEPARTLRWNWHIELICDAVQKQAEWQEYAAARASNPALPFDATLDSYKVYKRLLILISPGDLKSVLISVMRPAWKWLRWGHTRSLYFSHSEKRAIDDSIRTRDILSAPSYAKIRDTLSQTGIIKNWSFAADANEKHAYVNSLKGSRRCYGFDSRWTGSRGDDIVIDDPCDAGAIVKADPSEAAEVFANANSIISNKMQSRVNDMSMSTWTLMMQRLGEGDPAQKAIEDGDWYIICLPKEFNPNHPLRHPSDPRTEMGQLLNENFDNPTELARLKHQMSPRHYLAQYGQLSTAATDGLYTEATFVDCPRYVRTPDIESFTEIALTIDTAVKKTSTSDEVSAQVWGRKGWAERALLDRRYGRMGYLELKDLTLELNQRWHPAFTLVEDKASGPDLIADLSAAVPGILPFNPGSASKYERSEVGSAPLYRAHQKTLPDSTLFPWVRDFETNHKAFRGRDGDADGDIDAESQLDLYWNRLARQAPFLTLPPLPPSVSPAYTHAQGYSRHYVYSAHTLLADPALWHVAVVPPALTSPDVGHYGCAVVLSDQGDLVAHAVAPTTDSLASTVLLLCKSISDAVGTHHLAAPTAWQRRFRIRAVALSTRDQQAVNRLDDALTFRALPPHDKWSATPGALNDAAQRGRALLAATRLRVHDPDLHRILTRATLHPETGVPEVPRTTDGIRTYVGKPACIDGLLLACCAAFDAAGAQRDMLVQRQMREDERPKSSEEIIRARIKRMYGDAPSKPDAGAFGVFARKV